MNFGATVRLNPIGVVVIIGATILLLLFYFNLDDEGVSEVPKEVSLKKLLIAGIDVAQRGGKEVRAVRKVADLNEKSKGKTKEGVNDPITDGDIRSHRVMYYGLKSAFPNVKIISEEHDAMQVHVSDFQLPATTNDEVEKAVTDDEFVPVSDVTLWIDPLDATKEYTENKLMYVTTMVCVAVKGKPVIGVIHKPFEETTAWAWVGNGVAPDLEIEKEMESDQKKKITVSMSHAGKVTDIANESFNNDVEIIPAAGAGYKTLLVVSGGANAYVHTTAIKKWDICAGNAILQTLKGKMTTLQGQELDYSANTDPLNVEGLLATMYKHEFYLEKLKPLVQKQSVQ